MISKDFFTTGEAVRLISVVTRSTISRHFDRGILQGKKNPITGQRLISRESLIAYMEQYGLPVDALPLERKKVLLSTSDEHLSSLVREILSKDERIEIKQMTSAGEVLVGCSKIHPDLLILDEELPDIPIGDVIRALRRTGGLEETRIFCCMKPESEGRWLEWGADAALGKKDLNQESLSKKIYGLMLLSSEHSSEKSEEQNFLHQRRSPRLALNVPVKVQLYLIRAPYRRQTGTGTLENISLRGAYITEIKLERDEIPCEPFRILLEADQEPLKNLRASCKVLRLRSNGSLTAGVQFTRIPKTSLEIVHAFVRKEV